MDHAGHGLLKAWREGFAPTLSQAKAATRFGVSQPLVAEWEKGPRRPGLETAVAMETETNGAVPVEAWGYDRALVMSMASLVDRRRAEGDVRGAVAVAGIFTAALTLACAFSTSAPRSAPRAPRRANVGAAWERPSAT